MKNPFSENSNSSRGSSLRLLKARRIFSLATAAITEAKSDSNVTFAARPIRKNNVDTVNFRLADLRLR